jgi:hypothetical protein
MSSRVPRSVDLKPGSNATPADYDLRPEYSKGRNIPQTSRDALYKPVKTPGPADYDVTRRAPRRKRQSTHEFLPGQPRDIFADSRSHVDSCGLGHGDWEIAGASAPFGSRAKHGDLWGTRMTPGPGQYEVARTPRQRNSSAPFGARWPRLWAVGNDVPGPGSYKTGGGRRHVESDESVPFGQRSPRFDREYREHENGPGQYECDTADVVSRMRTVEQPSPPFLFSGDRNPYPTDPTVPGPARYSPEVGIRKAQSRKLRRCIDGTERAKPGTFVGNPISDAPGPGEYSPERMSAIRPNGIRGYCPHSKRPPIERNTCAPSPENYSTGADMLKPSLNVTFSVCKL